ncbi:MAG: polyketide cyclase [Flammeovirgaceae bacterium]|nr:polyketide cyclase [Flammeovirgaceae bacterium]MBR08128.1 polyketide cyclase [Rickettsiales bacterium]HCX22144.1 polyketide cyclase [Cytophagales bacterium]|tara:strand:- start:1447 stop:1896 length:450 start_codon:yes stop_codon:yes gene_type:complete
MKILGPLAKEGKINQDASVRDSQSTIINAPVDVVWNILSDISKWPEWNTDIKSVTIDQVSVGANFSWTIGGSTIKSTIRQIKEKELISWTGTTMGIKAIHVWKFEADGNQTIVTTEESMQGFFTLFFSHQKLHSSLLNWLDCLREAAEK